MNRICSTMQHKTHRKRWKEAIWKKWRDIPKNPICIHAVGVMFLLNLQTTQYQMNPEKNMGNRNKQTNTKNEKRKIVTNELVLLISTIWIDHLGMLEVYRYAAAATVSAYFCLFIWHCIRLLILTLAFSASPSSVDNGSHR